MGFVVIKKHLTFIFNKSKHLESKCWKLHYVEPNDFCSHKITDGISELANKNGIYF